LASSAVSVSGSNVRTVSPVAGLIVAMGTTQHPREANAGQPLGLRLPRRGNRQSMKEIARRPRFPIVVLK
jgi:hypothetical protein